MYIALQPNFFLIPSIHRFAAKAYQKLLAEKCASLNLKELSMEGTVAFSETLQECARESNRLVLEQYLQSFNVDEITLEHDGEILARQKHSPKHYHTEFGEIVLTRTLYYPKGHAMGHAYIPLDELWGMSGRCATPKVTERILRLCATGTLKETKESLEHEGIKVSESLIQKIINTDGQAVVEMMAEKDGLERWEEEVVPPETKAIVVSLDGVTVPLNEKGSAVPRPSSERPELGKKNPDQEKKSCFRMAMVGSLSFYGTETLKSSEATSLTSNEIIEPELLAPDRIKSIYVARMPEEGFPTFKQDVLSALGILEGRLEENTPVTKVLLMDGGLGLWGFVKENRCFDGYRKLIDYWHTCEHLSQLSQSLFAEQIDAKSLTKAWYLKWIHQLKHPSGAVQTLIESVQKHLETHKVKSSDVKEIQKQLGFFENNGAMMDYASFVREGLPIGSGPVEAACKMLVKQRMCQSGMRWCRIGGQCVLTLRTLYKSNQWVKTWKRYFKERFAMIPQPGIA